MQKKLEPPDFSFQKDDILESIYKKVWDFDYGISGAMETGEWIRYPHEIKDEVNCHEQGAYVYSVAKKYGLNPRFFKLVLSGGVGHSVVDVDIDGKRVMLDPHMGMMGEIDYFEDGTIMLKENMKNKGKKRIEFNSIVEVDEKYLYDDFKRLKESCIPMVVGGQQLSTIKGIRGGIDFVEYCPENKTLMRDMSFNGNGFINHIARKTYFFDESGEFKEKVEFFDYNHSNWNKHSGLGKIAEKKGDEWEYPKEIKEYVREAIANEFNYDKARGDSKTVHDEKYIKKFWGRYRKDMKNEMKTATEYRIEELKGKLKEYERFEKKTPKRFARKMDFLAFMEKNRVDKIPDNEEIREILPSYIERHINCMEKAKSCRGERAMGPIIEDISRDIKETYSKENLNRLSDEISDYGIAGIYPSMSNALKCYINEGFDEKTREDLVMLIPTLIVAPKLRKNTKILLDWALYKNSDDEHAEEISKIRDKVSSLGVLTDVDDKNFPVTYDFNPESKVLSINCGLVGKTGNYVTTITGYTVFGDMGEILDRGVRFSDKMPGCTSEYLFANSSGGAEHPDDSAINKELDESKAKILEAPNLVRIEPNGKKNFVERNVADLVIYSRFFGEDGDYPLYFTEKELDDYHVKIKDEMKKITESPFSTPWEKKIEKGNMEELSEVENKKGELYKRLEFSKLKGMLFSRKNEEILDLMRKKFGSDENIMDLYLTKFKIINEVTLGLDEFEEKRDALGTAISIGFRHSVPSKVDVEKLDYENEIFESVYKINDIIDHRRPWKIKGPEIMDKLYELNDGIFDIGTEKERKDLDECLRSFECRIRTRKKFYDWVENGGEHIVEEIQGMRDHLKELTPIKNIGFEYTDEMRKEIEEYAASKGLV